MKQVPLKPCPEKDVLEEMTAYAASLVKRQHYQQGYPFDMEVNLLGYYEWLVKTKLCDVTLINVGDPYKDAWDMLDTDKFERYVIDFFADAFHFNGTHWGVLSNGGSDGNMHGLHFGRKYLEDQAQRIGLPEEKRKPILYVSFEAHYSLRKLGDVLQIETRSIHALPDGRMDTDDLKRQMDATRPALVAIAIGGTFKGAIDDQEAIAKVLDEVKPPCVYRHLDAALFGGYLPWVEDEKARDILNHEKRGYDSIAVSGHKFLAMNEPVGLFLCRKEILNHLHNSTIPYLNTNIPTISCSRSGFDCLKLYWRIMTTGPEGFRAETKHVLAMTELLKKKLADHGWKTYVNPYSTTVCMTQPDMRVCHKYAMACTEYPDVGKLAHVVVMQFFNEAVIDELVHDIVTIR
ncbi:MAG: pyridoxal-dependent decarboxylase [Planctomycetia bacterium]|nr:pyridoxal-dependent decarboxylase [Planctomycetia bacterium]